MSNNSFVLFHFPAVKANKVKEKKKITVELEATLTDKADEYKKSLLIWKKKLTAEQEKMKDHRLKWQAKINKLDAKLESSVTRIKKQKQKCRDTIQQQIDEAANQEYELTCSIQDLEEVNVAHIEKYKDCMKQQKLAMKQSKWHREQATKQLVNWREERNARRDLQDEIARLSKVTANQKIILERYEAMIEQSEVTNKKEMKKE